MPCYSPLSGWRSKRLTPNGKRSIVFNKSEGYSDMAIQVPCGQCIGCRLEYSRRWAIRCLHESQMHKDNCFITLTYTNEKLPKNNTLVKEHFQKFMKRLRKKFNQPIKFYACGEYGDQEQRPHYHACLFGIDFTDKKLWTIRNDHRLYISDTLQQLWSDPKDGKTYGWCTIGEVNFETAAYVARYCMKKRKGKNWEQHYERVNTETGEIFNIQPEFPLMSRRPGLGRTWIEKYKENVIGRDSVIINAQEVKPPKYYDSIFEKNNPTDYEKIKAERRAATKKAIENNSLARLYTRGIVKQARINQLKRSIE